MARDVTKPLPKREPVKDLGDKTMLVMLETLGWAEEYRQWENMTTLVGCIHRAGYKVIRVADYKYMAVPR